VTAARWPRCRCRCRAGSDQAEAADGDGTTRQRPTEAPASAGRRHRVTGVSYGCCAGLIYGFAGVALKALSASIFAPPHARGGLLAAAVASPYLYAVLVSSAVGSGEDAA
jgi:hypothetical protein